jgi:HD-like signal output (HDOD) protein
MAAELRRQGETNPTGTPRTGRPSCLWGIRTLARISGMQKEVVPRFLDPPPVPRYPAAMPEQPPNPKQILAEMLQKGTLRALDKNVSDVCAVTKDIDSSLADLSAVIMRDAALSTNLLATANSVLYGGIEPARTISAAVIRLGFEKIRALALGLSIFKQVGQDARTPDLYRMYAGTYFAGSIAMELLRRSGYASPEEGFVSGMLGQVPRLLLANTFPQKYKEAERLMAAGNIPFDDTCRQVFGVEYRVIRSAVLEHWHLLEEVNPSFLTPEEQEATLVRANLVNEASNLADMLFGAACGGEVQVAQAEERIAKLLKVDSFSASECVQATSERDENINRFFKLTTKDVEMMVRIAQWGRVSTAQIASSLTLGSAQNQLEAVGETPEVAIGNYLTEMACLGRRGADINHLLILGQEAAFRCLRPTHVFLALLDASQTTLRGRFHAGSRGKIPPATFSVVMLRRENPIVQCMMAREPRRCEVKGEGWDSHLIAELHMRYVLMAPLVAHDRAIGMQLLTRSDEPPFSKGEQAWLEAITAHLGLAFERHR